MSRHSAREYLFKLTFEYLFSGEFNERTLGVFMADTGLTAGDREYLETAYKGITSSFGELRDLVAGFTEGFAPDRIFKPDLAAMIVAAYEMKYVRDIPAAVSINEAVDTVKRYSSEKSGAYVNGVLAGVNRHLKGEGE